METNPRKQRQHFYRDYASGQWSMSELCGRYQISRPTGYKWVDLDIGQVAPVPSPHARDRIVQAEASNHLGAPARGPMDRHPLGDPEPEIPDALRV
jgi:hypothetical protein